jgi:hypothetical protein
MLVFAHLIGRDDRGRNNGDMNRHCSVAHKLAPEL